MPVAAQDWQLRVQCQIDGGPEEMLCTKAFLAPWLAFNGTLGTANGMRIQDKWALE